jgi:hypothetical protein
MPEPLAISLIYRCGGCRRSRVASETEIEMQIREKPAAGEPPAAGFFIR